MSETKAEQIPQLEKQLATTVAPEERVPLLNTLSEHFRYTDLGKAKTMAEEARILSLELNDKTLLAESLLNLGRSEEMQYNFGLALKYLLEAEELLTAQQNLDKLFLCLSSIGKSHTQQGEYLTALKTFYKSVELAEKMSAPQKHVNALINTGIVHARIEEWHQAIELYERAISISKASDYPAGIGFSLVNMGASYMALDNPQKGLEAFIAASEVMKNSTDRINYSNTLGNIGIAYSKTGQYELAEKYLKESFDIKEETGDHFNQLSNHLALAVLYRLKKELPRAEAHIVQAMEIAERANSIYLRKQTFQAYHEFYEETGQFEKALHYYKLAHKLEKEIMGEEKNRQMKNLQVKYEVDSIRNEKEIYRLKNIDLASANEQIYHQKTLIEEKNKDITDSISYARRIQRALLAHGNDFKNTFADYFLLYRPKDIVSGDFYWGTAAGDKFLFAVCDCTGHGVPGAFMSLLNISFLNEAAGERNITRPDLMLNYVRERIIRALTESGAESDTNVKDGMDAVICSYDCSSKLLEFASANNPLWLVRDGKLQEFAPDKMPVGRHEGAQEPFTLHRIQLQPGDTLYVFTDGYADQFGGPKGKKFKYRQLAAKLVEIHALPMSEQQRLLEETFDAWKGNLEQIDDVLIGGFRI